MKIQTFFASSHNLRPTISGCCKARIIIHDVGGRAEVSETHCCEQQRVVSQNKKRGKRESNPKKREGPLGAPKGTRRSQVMVLPASHVHVRVVRFCSCCSFFVLKHSTSSARLNATAGINQGIPWSFAEGSLVLAAREVALTCGVQGNGPPSELYGVTSRGDSVFAARFREVRTPAFTFMGSFTLTL